MSYSEHDNKREANKAQKYVKHAFRIEAKIKFDLDLINFLIVDQHQKQRQCREVAMEGWCPRAHGRRYTCQEPRNLNEEAFSMGITVGLKSGSEGGTWPADTVLLRFDQTGLQDVVLSKQGQAVYPGGSIPPAGLDGLEASDENAFAVVLEDGQGNKQGPFPARWVKVGYPPEYDVAFGPHPLKQTKEGLVGQMRAARVSDQGLEVSVLNLTDR